MEEIVWRKFRFEMPSDWEMLAFSRSWEHGKCSFADRYSQRLEWHWQTAAAEPDLPRTVDRFLEAEPGSRKALCGGWIGVEAKQSTGERISRYLRYFPEECCTVEMVFSWPGRRDENLLRQILESMRLEKPNHGLQRWRAAGLELWVKEGAILSECQIAPAMARMKFENTAHKVTEEFQRLGMVPEWLGAPVADWLKEKVPSRMKAVSGESHETDGHSISELEAQGYLERFSRMLRRPASFTAAAWLCPNDGRLYYHSRTMEQRNTESQTGRLSCCPRFTHG